MQISEWIQVVAILIPAAIELAKWRWEVKRIATTPSDTATIVESKIKTPPFRFGWSSKLVLLTPLLVIGWQTFRAGSLGRFDLGIMVFSLLVFISFFMSLLILRLYTIFVLQAHTAESLASIAASLGGKVQALDGVVERLRSRAAARQKEEDEKVAS